MDFSQKFGRISAEACSMTKPVIATNHGGSREIIENKVTGWLTKPNDSKELAGTIVDVLKLHGVEICFSSFFHFLSCCIYCTIFYRGDTQ